MTEMQGHVKEERAKESQGGHENQTLDDYDSDQEPAGGYNKPDLLVDVLHSGRHADAKGEVDKKVLYRMAS